MSQLRERTPETDALFDLLAEERRRHALALLCEHEAPLALADLADEVAVRERDRRLPAIAPEETKRVYVDLYHVHVPKLVDDGVAIYEQERDLVGVAPAVDAAAMLETISAVPAAGSGERDGR